jgi:ABC-type transport system involved in multi-copper enzyme maturation permease subunit
LFLFAFFWFILYAGITQVGAAVTTTMQQYSGNTTYPAFEYASTFMVNLWKYLLAIAVIGLLLWAMIYSQRKGEVMYG